MRQRRVTGLCDPSLPEILDGDGIEIGESGPFAHVGGIIVSRFGENPAHHIHRHIDEAVSGSPPCRALIENRHSDRARLNFKNEHPFSLFFQNVKINPDVKAFHQPVACYFRLVERLTSDHDIVRRQHISDWKKARPPDCGRTRRIPAGTAMKPF